MEHGIIQVNLIVEGYSPRRNFEAKEDLKASIEKEGLLEPILVRKDGNIYVIIDGNRRFHAVKELRWKLVDCTIIDADEERSYRISYVKNTERQNFSAIEEALHLQAVLDKYQYNVEDLVRLGYATHRSTLDHKLSLLTLPEDLQEKIIEGTIGPSHGYQLAKLPDEQSQKQFAARIIARGGVPVRKLKEQVRSHNVQRKRKEQENQPVIKIPQGDIPGVFIKNATDMAELANESVGLIVMSPPYGVGMGYEKGFSLEEHLEVLRKVFSECNRVLVPGGKICVNFGDIHNFGTRNGGKPEIKLMGHHYQEIMKNHGLRLIDTFIWKKCTPGKRDFNWSANPQANYRENMRHGSYRPINNTEHIYIFEKNGNRNVDPDIEDASRISKEQYYKWVDGVWEIPPVKKQEGHPAQFPEDIPRRLIKMYSCKGDLVLDPFGGSMTTVKVANELGRIGVGYEKEEKYKPIIMKKLGIKEEDLKKPKVMKDDFVDQVQAALKNIVISQDRSVDAIMSVHVPVKDKVSKDDITIEWNTEGDDPDPSGLPSPQRICKADDYDGNKKSISGIHQEDSLKSIKQTLTLQKSRVLQIRGVQG